MFFFLPRRSRSMFLLYLAGACHSNHPAEQTEEAAATRVAPVTNVITPPTQALYPGTRRYTGRVGSYPVVVELTYTDTITLGTYYYQRHGQELNLRGSRAASGQPLILQEVIGDSLLATWHATQAAGPLLQGTWRSANGQRQLPFTLQEDYRGAVRYAYEYFYSRSQQAEDSVVCGQPGVRPSLELEVVHLLETEHQSALQQVQQQLLPGPFSTLGAYVDEQVSAGNGDCSEIKKHAWITYNANHLLSVTLMEQVYQFGGAHPTHDLLPMTFDLRTGHQLRLQELLRPGYQQPLRRLLTQRLQRHFVYGDFYQQEGGIVGQPFERWLDEQGRPQSLVPLPRNGFRLTPAGMEFEWGEYEIGPYVIGPQTVEISYAEMKPLLRPNGVLRDVLARFN